VARLGLRECANHLVVGVESQGPPILFVGQGLPAFTARMMADSTGTNCRWTSGCSIGTPLRDQRHNDPRDPVPYTGVEIDAKFRSQDGGETWTHVETGLYISLHPRRRLHQLSPHVLTSTPVSCSSALDGEKAAARHQAKWPLPYAGHRGADDPGVLFTLAVAKPPPARKVMSCVPPTQENRDMLNLPTPANSTIRGPATHPAEANRIRLQPFGRSTSAMTPGTPGLRSGEFGEIRAAWLPN
jgi:hypothetical protein